MTDVGRLCGRRILLSGGASGIGAASVRACARAGADVVFVDVDVDRGRAIEAEAAGSPSGSARFMPCDVTRRDAVIEVASRAAEHLGGLDVVVAAAGVEGAAAAETVSEAELMRMIQVNTMGTVWLNQASFPALRESRGSIINFGSSAGIVGSPEMPHYSLSKGAVLAWTRAIAQAWMTHGIRANAVVPAIWTPMYDGRRARFRNEAERAAHDARRATSMLGGRLGDPDRDMAPVMVFLASEDAGFITGQTIAVNGGSLIVT